MAANISYRLETNTYSYYIAVEVRNVHYAHTQVKHLQLHFVVQDYCHCQGHPNTLFALASL
jgi:hypothetical protein